MFSVKNSKMAAKNWKNRKFSYLLRSIFYYPAGQKFDRNRSISYGFRDICDFTFSAKIQDGGQKLKKIEKFWYILRSISYTTLRVKNSIEIALSLTIFEIFAILCFPQKFKMAAQNWKNGKFWYLLRSIFSHPAGPKFARNRSISYGFRDICDFSFSAKIQDGRPKL